jgi:hypothetical protein
MTRRSLVPAFLVFMALGAVRADALTVRDVIELSKAGLSDSVLMALIDVDRTVFSIDTATLKQLKTEGVSDAVIIAMIHSGRATPADVPPPAQPEVVAQDTSAQDTSAPAMNAPAMSAPAMNAPDMSAPTEPAAPVPPQFVPYPVFVPLYVAVPVAPGGKNAHRSAQHAPAVSAVPCFESKIPEWGFGGKAAPQVAAACGR